MVGTYHGERRDRDHRPEDDRAPAPAGLYVIDVKGTVHLPVPFLDEDVQAGDPFRLTIAMVFDDPVVTTDGATFHRLFNDEPNLFLVSAMVGDTEVEHAVQASVGPDDGTTLVVGDDTTYREFLVLPEPPRVPMDLVAAVAPGTAESEDGQTLYLRAQIHAEAPSGTMVDGIDPDGPACFTVPEEHAATVSFSRFREGPIGFDADIIGIPATISINAIDPREVFEAANLALLGYPVDQDCLGLM